MGLRMEQFNIEDLLKYFVGRNEFRRKDLVNALKGLTDEERSTMNITNYSEFYSYYKFLYRLLKEDLLTGVVSTPTNSKELIARSFYEEEFLRRYPFEYILTKRLNADITREHKFVYNESESAWNYILADGNEIFAN